MRLQQKKVLPYTDQQLYELVADIPRYPEFLPWCLAVDWQPIDANRARAKLAVGFRFLRERFTSVVVFEPGCAVCMSSSDGPFRSLQGEWRFASVDGKGGPSCRVEFSLEFVFRSVLVEKTFGPVFGEAQRRLIVSFEKRAADLYGLKRG